MKTSTVIALGGLGLAAWYLTRRGPVYVPGPNTQLGTLPLGTTTVDDLTVIGDNIPGVDIDWFLQFGQRADLCDLPDDRHTAWTDAQKACVGQFHAARANAFVKQVILPASRVPISSLTKEDFALASAFLGNKLTRRGCPWTYGQSKAVNDFNDEVGWASTVIQIFAPIVDALSFGLVTKAGNSISQANGGGTTSDAEHVSAAYEAAITSVPQYTGSGENKLTVKQSPTPGIDYDPSDPLIAAMGGAFDPAKQAYDSPFINGFGPSLDFGFDPIVFPDRHQYFLCELFGSSNESTTWEMPWISQELGYPSDGGDGGSLTDKTLSAKVLVKHARLYRTLATLAAMLRPFYLSPVVLPPPDAEGNVDITKATVTHTTIPGTHSFTIGTVTLWGCVLPPGPGDPVKPAALAGATTLVHPGSDGSDIPPTSQATIDSEAKTLVTPVPSVSPVATQSTLVTAPSAGATAPPTATVISPSAIASHIATRRR